MASDISTGTVEPEAMVCEHCASRLRPHIVPPTWMKSLDDTVLQRTWQRGFERLLDAEILVAIGYSLPAADPKLRELLHVGLSSARLRQAMVVVGGDEGAAERWNAMFRESWRDYRLSIRSERFEEMAGSVLFAALSITDSGLKDRNLQLLPFGQSPAMNPEAGRRLASSLHLQSSGNAGDVDWVQIARDWRVGKPAAESIMMYRKLLAEAGFNNWVPSGPILPAHGNVLT